MMEGSATIHQIARAALDSRITHGDIAHHSGKAEDFLRSTSRKLCALFDCDIYKFVVFDVVRNHAGDCKIIIDIDSGYWDHRIPESAYRKFIARADSGAC